MKFNKPSLFLACAAIVYGVVFLGNQVEGAILAAAGLIAYTIHDVFGQNKNDDKDGAK